MIKGVCLKAGVCVFAIASFVPSASADHEKVPYSQLAKYNKTFFDSHVLLAPFYELSPDHGTNVNSIMPIDVNGDGALDIVVTYVLGAGLQATRLMKVYVNDGEGNFVDRTTTVFPSGVPRITSSNNYLWVVADLNGDGRPDAYLGDWGDDSSGPNNKGPAPEVLLLSSGAHGFINATSKLGGNAPTYTHNVAAADVDGDGDIDLYNVDMGEVTPSFFINDGSGNFVRDSSRIQVSGYLPNVSGALADMNGDGKNDLIMGGGNAGRNLLLVLNDGNGNFLDAGVTELSYIGREAADVVKRILVHDFNGDGRQDLFLLVNRSGENQFVILINHGGGVLVDESSHHFMDTPKHPDGWLVYDVILADANNDGYVDLINNSTVWFNDGAGRFKKVLPGAFLPLPTNPDGSFNAYGTMQHLAVGDFNKDGLLDFIGWNHVYWEIWPQKKTFYAILYGKPLPLAQTGDNNANTILGGPKSETLSGMGGNDIIFAAGGNDKVFGGTGSDYLNGGDGNDEIDGGPGNDTLVGGKGNDKLTGGIGKDIFVFNAPLTAANVDTIVDFSPVDDKIHLDKNFFRGMVAGPLSANAFAALPGVLSASTRIIYNKATGGLFFDFDGAGGAAPVLFAKLKTGLVLSSSNFVVY